MNRSLYTSRAGAALRDLERRRDTFGPGAAEPKLALLATLDRSELPSARAVFRLHECLCFLRTYPDDRRVQSRVEEMLSRFDRRRDLRRFREDLLDTGIAGTPIYYAFFWPTARRLVARWPERLTMDWDTFAGSEALESLLPLLVTYSETPALDLSTFSAREWLSRLKGPRETDAAFLIRRFEHLCDGGLVPEALFESFDPFFRLEPGPDTPSRTRAKRPGSRVVPQRKPLDRARPELARALRERPRSVRRVSRAEGERLVALAQDAMLTRARDLDAFAHADPRDVFLVEWGDGLQFAGMGMVPDRRLLLESVYGFLTLKNGVPIGYVLSSALFRSSEIAYNVFETYRGGESAAVFGRVIAMVGHLFGSTSFALDPYQLGYGNDEGLRSGAWWFYYKMGFRPRDPGVRRVLREELARMRRNPGHRSNRKTLEQLASEYTFFQVGTPRRDVLGLVDLGAIGRAVSGSLARRFGSDREEGIRRSSQEAADLLGVRSRKGWTRGERTAWERWSPLVLLLPGVERWTPAEKHHLIEIVRAKGGRSELAFVERVNRHPRLLPALLAISKRR